VSARTKGSAGRPHWLRQLLGLRAGAPARGRELFSPASLVEHADRLVLGQNVSVGPFSYIDASGHVTLEEGVQIASHVAIVTHSPHRSQRLLGPAYRTWPHAPGMPRPGWIGGPVHIGAYSFVGPHSLVEANSRLGRGTLVCAGSFVRGDYPDFVILEGRPARVIGDSRHADERLLQRYPELRILYDAWTSRPTGDGHDAGDLVP
jgi:acetyltransferase-like isoleucine patch superfamily enzyme